MLKVLECKRNEENKPFDPETAQQYATELYNAGGGRTIGTIRYDTIWCKPSVISSCGVLFKDVT